VIEHEYFFWPKIHSGHFSSEVKKRWLFFSLKDVNEKKIGQKLAVF